MEKSNAAKYLFCRVRGFETRREALKCPFSDWLAFCGHIIKPEMPSPCRCCPARCQILRRPDAHWRRWQSATRGSFDTSGSLFAGRTQV